MTSFLDNCPDGRTQHTESHYISLMEQVCDNHLGKVTSNGNTVDERQAL